MNIEQYFGGRIRYIQVGDHGDSRPGFGCYAKSPGVSGQDVVEIQKRYKQYLNAEENKKGIKPTIYKRVLLPTGTVLMTACSYIPSPQGKNGPIDRPDWIDHSYLVRGDDPAALDPEKWLGLPYRTDDPNPVWEVIPPQVEAKIRNGEVYKTDKWITARSLDRFPASDFHLLPLAQVLDMWELDDVEMVDLTEAVMDCVAAPDMGGRKLFIKYDINAEDCAGNRFWDRAAMDAEQFNAFRMRHLLAWIYILIPFSFRRRLGYDTMLDANAGYHQIIFVPVNRIRTTGGQYAYMFPAFDGTNLSENKNIMMTGGGYYYDHERGIWHNPSAGNKDYEELYQTEGIVQRLISEEVGRYLKAESIEQTRRIIKEYYSFFENLEKHIPIYSESIAELESEIPRWKAALVADPEELKGMALTLLDRQGGEDISANEGNYEYFLHVVTALESRITEGNRDQLWTPVLEAAVTRPAFKEQLNFVRELARVILSKEDRLRIFDQYASREDFRNASVEGVGVLTWLFAGLSEDEEFRSAWLSVQYGAAGEYTARLKAFDRARVQYDSLAGATETEPLQAANAAYYESLPLLTDTDNVRSLLATDSRQVSREAFELAGRTAQELAADYSSLEICQRVAEEGPSVFREFRDGVSNSPFNSAAVLTDHLLETVFGEWLERFKFVRISPEELSAVIDLLNEYESDSRYDEWAKRLLGVTGKGPLFEELTTEEFGRYQKQVIGTDPRMLKVSCRIQLFAAALKELLSGETKADHADLKRLSEYLTAESKNGNSQYSNWLKGRVNAGVTGLTDIIFRQIRAERSLAPAAQLFENLNDDNILNCEQTRDGLLAEAGEITEYARRSGSIGEKNIREFEQAFRWWSSEPAVRAERRKIVRAANYKPTFAEISETIDIGSRSALEKLFDDGFIYEKEQDYISDGNSLLEAMKHLPSDMDRNQWVDCYCDWIEEAFGLQDLGRSGTDYRLLDTMCGVVLGAGVQDVSPGARVNQEWFKSLMTSGLKTDKIRKKGLSAGPLVILTDVKEVCDQITAVKAKKVNVSDPAVNNVIRMLILNGKLNIRYNEKTLDAICSYVREQPNFFRQLLYNWRPDRIFKMIGSLRENLSEQELRGYQNEFERNRFDLNRIYTDIELDAFRKALGIEDRTARGAGFDAEAGGRFTEGDAMAARGRSSAGDRSTEEDFATGRDRSSVSGRSARRGQTPNRNKRARKY